jgi:hypothetical protein
MSFCPIPLAEKQLFSLVPRIAEDNTRLFPAFFCALCNQLLTVMPTPLTLVNTVQKFEIGTENLISFV